MLTAPFPWFGGKSKVAPQVWSAFTSRGPIGNYIEPFFGSGAVLLQRPATFVGRTCVNDIDGFVANFWRAVKAAPAEVAALACDPVNEADLHARHVYLIARRDALTDRLMADPDHFDTKIAAWWAWGACCWIGSGWCAGDGPWRPVLDDDGVARLSTGNGGKGVRRQIPHLGNGGQGVHRQIGGDRLAWLSAWCARLAEALRDVRITCGDWERICSVGTMTRNSPCGVFLDPPYSGTEYVYGDRPPVSSDVFAWCVANGQNEALRIVLCGHAGEHDALLELGWNVESWASHGYQGGDDRERLYLSPGCGHTSAQARLF